MVQSIRNIENLLGKENIFPSRKEVKRRKIYHRSVMSVKKIKKNEIFSIDNISLKRSNGRNFGLLPKYFFKLIGKKALKK